MRYTNTVRSATCVCVVDYVDFCISVTCEVSATAASQLIAGSTRGELAQQAGVGKARSEVGKEAS